MSRTERSLEDEIVQAYKANKTIPAIMEEFGKSRTTVYHIIQRRGLVPSRTVRRMSGASRDAQMAGLYEVIDHQDKVIAEKEAVIAEVTARLKAAERQLSRAQAKRVASNKRAAS